MRDANSTSRATVGAFADARQRFCSRNPPCRRFRNWRSCAEMLAAGYRVIRANSLRVSQIS